MSQENSALLSSPQEPPEDDANIIEKILASRMVQKEVSGWRSLGQRRDETWLPSASRDMRHSSSWCCHAIPCTRSSQGAARVCPDGHLSGLGIKVEPLLPWAWETSQTWADAQEVI